MSADVERKLTTILAADAEGFSRVMEEDEDRGFAALRVSRGVFETFIARHHGRIANTAGDGLIAEFPSVVEAVRCAIGVQQELAGLDRQVLPFRIGVHLGDVLVNGADLLGEGVNLAARLESMAAPGEVLISQQVYDQVAGKLGVGFDFVGDRRPKNYAREVPVYRVLVGGAAAGARAAPRMRVAPVPAEAPGPASDRGRVWRRARQYGVLAGGLVALDLATGTGIWAHWLVLVLAALWGLEAAPVLATGPLTAGRLRSLVVVAGLAAINLLTWQGTAWVLWPAGALLALHLVRIAAARR